MQKRQVIEGLTAELYGLIGTISVYKRTETWKFADEYEQIRMLRLKAFNMDEDEIRRQFQNLRVKFQIEHMMGMRSLRCRSRVKNGKVKLTEFHIGDPVMLTHPIELPDGCDGLGYVRIKGKVTNILGDSTIIFEPDSMFQPDGIVC